MLTININPAGGIEKDISMLSEQLLLSGEWSVDIVSLFSTETKTKMVFPAEVNIIHCSIKRFDRKETFRYLKAFLKECENKYEYLMTFHSEISSFVSLLRKRISQMKWIATEHISMDFYTKKRRILNLVSYRRADKLVVLTDEYNRYYRKHGLKNVVTIVNPLPFEPIETDLSHNRAFITVARLEEIKRIDLIIRSFAIVSHKYPDWTLTIVGDGSQKKKLQKLAMDCLMEDKIDFAGFHQDVVPFLKKGSAFVIASDYEGLPLSCLEALSVGLPLISTELPSIREITGGYGFALISPRGSVDGLADSMEKIINCDDLTREEWKEEITRCIQKFRIESVMAKWYEILNQLS